MNKIQNFENMKLGMFVHFGLYSIVGKGEWYMHNENVPPIEYEKLIKIFKVRKSWAKDIVETAQSFGAKYIVLTTRHHDGFSLYDSGKLSSFNALNSPTGRDLVKEFVIECRKRDIIPFFYHTLIDWHEGKPNGDSEEYFDYLCKSIELLCKNYGQIGGFWFDGTWSNDDLDWHLDKIFSIVRKYQPQAIICNNGGQEYPGQIIHKEIDCIVYERVSSTTKTQKLDNKHRAKEVCQTINKHWGYCKSDKNYKSAKQLAELYEECRENNANLLINVGPKKSGIVGCREKLILKKFSRKIK